MEVINNIEMYDKTDELSIALGSFDGIHLAHTKVLEEAVNSEYLPAVFTFSQVPSGIVNGEPVKKILTKSLKIKKLSDKGIKIVFSPSFLDFKDMSAKDFVDMLAIKLNVKKITCGFNFRFGAGAKGNPQLLKELCKEYGIKLTVIPPVLVDGEIVSSTRIRGLIEAGELEKTRTLLGGDFAYDFEVVSGNQIGSSWEIPTINQIFDTNFCIPKYGVYASKTIIDGKEYKSITNIGIKPTIGSNEVSSETNIFEFDGDLYGRNVKVILKFFIRDERRFEDVDELKRAINKDIEYVKNMVY